MTNITTEDRARFHELLDYALDTAQDYVIMQFARADLDFHIRKKIYKLHLLKEDETRD